MSNGKLGELARQLLAGTLPECRPDELAAAVAHIATEMVPAKQGNVEQIRKALACLNNARQFALARGLAIAWREEHDFDPTVDKRLAQALIDLGSLDEAEHLLHEAIPKAAALHTPNAASEALELRGLLGRVAKQRFVLSENPDALAQAIDIYGREYEQAVHPCWHGINVAALLAAQTRLGLTPDAKWSVAAVAENVLRDVLEQLQEKPGDHWLYATASEALLALKRWDDAELWLYRFLNHPKTNPFAIQSYSRQLREIWQGNSLRGATCADRLSRIIETHEMQHQRSWSLSSQMLKTLNEKPDSFEINFSGEGMFTVTAIRGLLKNCASIGCVTDSTGVRMGTGFVVSADKLGLGEAQEPVFVTNAHVISNDVPKAVRPDAARVTFEIESLGKDNPVFHKVMPQVLFTSPPGELGIPAANRLDATVVKLDKWPKGAQPLATARHLPLPSSKTRLFIVG
ncbi:MAG: hypothetical protein LBE59_04115, partial [Nevskiaceae bacterium]|nr:hypothetical protein [Nevskiaceae bacterium]